MRRTFPLILAAAMFAALSIAPAGADEIDASFRLVDEGGFLIGTFPETLGIPVGGTGITGIYDDETGDFEGQFEIGSIPPLELDVGLPVLANVALVGGPVTGSFDEDTGEVELATTLTFEIEVVSPVAAICSIPGIELNLSSSNPGGSPFDPEDGIDAWVFTVTDTSFTVPEATGPGGDVPCSVISDALELPVSSGNSMVLNMESGTIPPDVPVDPIEPPGTNGGNGADPATATPAAPRFTG